MPRSPESLAKRRAYCRAWRARNPEYHKTWRESNRDKERERAAKWRAENPDKVAAQRKRYAEAHPYVPRERQEEIPPLHTGHDLFDYAKAIVSKIVKIDNRTRVYDPLYEDCVSEAVLALLEGRNAASAVHALKAESINWKANVITGSGLEDPSEFMEREIHEGGSYVG